MEVECRRVCGEMTAWGGVSLISLTCVFLGGASGT